MKDQEGIDLASDHIKNENTAWTDMWVNKGFQKCKNIFEAKIFLTLFSCLNAGVKLEPEVLKEHNKYQTPRI